MQLSEESRALHLIETKLGTKFNKLIGILDAKEELIGNLQRENATLRSDMDGLRERLDNMEVNKQQCDVFLPGDYVPVGAAGENIGAVAATTL